MRDRASKGNYTVVKTGVGDMWHYRVKQGCEFVEKANCMYLYIYRDNDDDLFATSGRSAEKCRALKDAWLRKKQGGNQ